MKTNNSMQKYECVICHRGFNKPAKQSIVVKSLGYILRVFILGIAFIAGLIMLISGSMEENYIVAGIGAAIMVVGFVVSKILSGENFFGKGKARHPHCPHCGSENFVKNY